jgi:hypothetical protein
MNAPKNYPQPIRTRTTTDEPVRWLSRGGHTQHSAISRRQLTISWSRVNASLARSLPLIDGWTPSRSQSSAQYANSGGPVMAQATQESKQTTDHDEIRQWVESRGGKPATITGTERGGEEAGLLRIDMPTGASNPPLEPIAWDDFFQKFDEENLAFLYQDAKADGSPSFFCKFVNREGAKPK